MSNREKIVKPAPIYGPFPLDWDGIARGSTRKVSRKDLMSRDTWGNIITALILALILGALGAV